MQNIEVIDITGNGNNTLDLKASDVLDMSSTTNTLKVVGNAGDTVDVNAMHETGVTHTEAGVTYKVYAEAGVSIELWVDKDLTVI